MNLFRCLSVWIVAAGIAGTASAIAPKITHAPVTTAVRGTPTPLHCTVDSHGLLLTQTVARIRLSETGSPSTMALKPSGADSLDCLVPVSMVEGVQTFWYSLDISNEKGETSSTVWQRVVIIEAAVDGKHGGGGAAVGGGGSGSGGAGGGAAGGAGGGAGGSGIIGKNPATWIGGGILIVGAGIGINEMADGDGGGGGGRPPPTTTNKVSRPPRTTTSPYACTSLSGLEQVTYENLTVSNSNPIIIRVCRTCTNATIEASADWDEYDSISGFNNPNCSPTAPTLSLNKPVSRLGIPNNTYVITVIANGQTISSITWPQDSSPPPVILRPLIPTSGK